MAIDVPTHQKEDDIRALISFLMQAVGLHEFFHVGIAQLSQSPYVQSGIEPFGKQRFQVLLQFQFIDKIDLRILMRAKKAPVVFRTQMDVIQRGLQTAFRFVDHMMLIPWFTAYDAM